MGYRRERWEKTHRRRAPIHARCGATTKVAFPSQEAALARAAQLNPRPTMPHRAYTCPYCGLWHLTSQDLRA